MQLRDDLCLDTAVRALRDTVRPAVNADDAHAREQLDIVIGLLSLVTQRQEWAWRYDLDELTRMLDFGQALAGLAGMTAGAALTALATAGADVLARAQAAPAEVREATRALREASGALAAVLYSAGDAEQRARVKLLVLDNAAAQLERERAWFAPQGWEPDAAALPALGDLLA